MKKIAMILVLLGIVYLLGLAGCSRGPKIPVLKLSSWGDPKENQILSAIIADFQKTHPEVKVELDRVSYGEYMTKLFTQAAAGIAPDVIFVGTGSIPNLAAKGTLEPLDEYLKAEPDFPINDFWPMLIKAFKVNGRLYGIPRDMDAECDVYYSQKAFDEAHLPYPKDNWTWDEFLKDAQALTQRDAKGNVTRWGYVDFASLIDPWVYSLGGRWVDDPYHPTRYAFNTPAFVKGIQFRADLIHKYKVTPDPASLNAIAGSASDLFMNGGAAMFFSGFWYTPTFRDIKAFKWDMAVIPKAPGGKRGYSQGGSGYGILSTSKNKKAAWELVKFMAGPEGQNRMAQSGLVFPALKSVAKSKYFLDNQPPLNKGAILKMVPDGVLTPQALNWDEIVASQITPILDRVWIGTSTAQEAVSLLAEKVKDKPLIVK